MSPRGSVSAGVKRGCVAPTPQGPGEGFVCSRGRAGRRRGLSLCSSHEVDQASAAAWPPGGAACPCLCGVNQGAKGGVACCPLVFPPSEKSSFPLFFLIQHWSHRELRFASPCLSLVLAGTLFSCRRTPSHFPKTHECVKGAPSASSGDPSVADRMSYRDL